MWKFVRRQQARQIQTKTTSIILSQRTRECSIQFVSGQQSTFYHYFTSARYRKRVAQQKLRKQLTRCICLKSEQNLYKNPVHVYKQSYRYNRSSHPNPLETPIYQRFRLHAYPPLSLFSCNTSSVDCSLFHIDFYGLYKNQ